MPSIKYWGRRVAAVVLVLTLLPVAVTGVQQIGGPDVPQGADVAPDDLTVITTQGNERGVPNADDGVLEGVRTSTGELVWLHDEYEWYYDVDPVDDETLLFIARDRDNDFRTIAVEWNWVTDEEERVFELPADTHDVDRLDEHRYAVADIQNHRVFEYNYTADGGAKRATDEIEWEWSFVGRYPESDGGEEGHDGDWTHLNDVDLIDDGDAYLLSPRDFNRVLAVNRTTKEVDWTLGEQDDPAIISGQHDPIVLDDDPLTVLVGDSLNHRVVEYQRVDGEWEQTWSWSDDGFVNWPRDVDRLPNGNTILADTGNSRVVEVAPNGTVVWEYDTTNSHPYDVERVHLGDEPAGPTMVSMNEENVVDDVADATTGDPFFKWAYRTAGWVLPTWVGHGEFVALVIAVVTGGGWLLAEAGARLRGVLRARGYWRNPLA